MRMTTLSQISRFVIGGFAFKRDEYIVSNKIKTVIMRQKMLNVLTYRRVLEK